MFKDNLSSLLCRRLVVLTMLLTFVYDRKNENHWSLLIICYSLLITRNTNTRIIIVKSSANDVSNLNRFDISHLHGFVHRTGYQQLFFFAILHIAIMHREYNKF